MKIQDIMNILFEWSPLKGRENRSDVPIFGDMEQDVTKVPVPEELGAAPEYAPKKKREGGRGGNKRSGNKGRGKGGNHRQGKKKNNAPKTAGENKGEQKTTTPQAEGSSNKGEKKNNRKRYYHRPKRDKGSTGNVQA